MKTIFTFLALVVIFSINSYGQDSIRSKIIEPDFPFEPMYLDSNYVQTALPLEHHENSAKTGIAKAEFIYIINTPKSSLIINKTNSIKMVVKQGLVNGTMTNVKDMYKLFKAKEDSKKRIISYAKFKTKTMDVYDGLPITYKKIKDDIFLLIFDNLEPGEYVIVAKTNLYSFSIK